MENGWQQMQPSPELSRAPALLHKLVNLLKDLMICVLVYRVVTAAK